MAIELPPEEVLNQLIVPEPLASNEAEPELQTDAPVVTGDEGPNVVTVKGAEDAVPQMLVTITE